MSGPSSQVAGVPQPVAPGIVRLLAPNPSAFTFTGTQVHLVGERSLVVIDPGPEDAVHDQALLRAVDGRPVTAILITHTHRDHSPASRALAAATGAPIIGCRPLAATEVGQGAEASFDSEYAPARVLGEGEAVETELGPLTAIETPGHTSNHLCFALEREGALFSGDHVMGWSTTVVVPPDGDMGAYIASLEKLRGRDEQVYYPAHGDPVTNPQRLLRGMIGHRLQRERQILRLLEDGCRNVAAIVAGAYPGLDPRLVPAAGGSVLAHLLDLERRGRVVRAGEDWCPNANA